MSDSVRVSTRTVTGVIIFLALFAVVTGFLLLRPSQKITDVISEVKPGWTERMVKARFPNAEVIDQRDYPEDPDWPSQNTFRVREGSDTALILCFGGVVREVAVTNGYGYEKVWGSVSDDIMTFVMETPTAKMREEQSKRAR